MTVATDSRNGLRPAVHLTPPSGWMNDPHGVLHVDGLYHLFFQYVPGSLTWRPDCHWGHATSADLLHWEVQPIALFPDGEEVGVWSGSAVVGDDGVPVLLYTAAQEDDLDRSLVRAAHPVSEDLVEWRKGEVLVRPREGDAVFRDPVVFREGDHWRMLVGQGTSDEVAGVSVYRSPDLQDWEYDGLLTTRPATAEPYTGVAWECPQLVQRTDGLDSDVLIVSVWNHGLTLNVAATAGIYVDGRFAQGAWQTLTAGTSGHYAASHFADVDGRPCLVFWIRGVGQPGAWTGAISVPYVVSNDGERIVLTPHPAVAAARTAPDGDEPATALDIEWSPRGTGHLSLVGPDCAVRADLALADGVLTVTVPGADPVVVEHHEPTLRVIADAQVLEVVAAGGLVGLPLADVAGGCRPVADDPSRLAWWHLS